MYRKRRNRWKRVAGLALGISILTAGVVVAGPTEVVDKFIDTVHKGKQEVLGGNVLSRTEAETRLGQARDDITRLRKSVDV